MGSHGTRIGKYWMAFHDYNLAGLPETAAKPDRFKKRIMDLDFIFVGDKNDERVHHDLHPPLTDVIPLKQNGSRYELDWNKFNLEKTLWDELMKRNIQVFVNPYIIGVNYTDPKNSIVYYLQSRLQRTEVILSSVKPTPYRLISYNDIEWLTRKSLRYDQ